MKYILQKSKLVVALGAFFYGIGSFCALASQAQSAEAAPALQAQPTQQPQSAQQSAAVQPAQAAPQQAASPATTPTHQAGLSTALSEEVLAGHSCAAGCLGGRPAKDECPEGTALTCDPSTDLFTCCPEKQRRCNGNFCFKLKELTYTLEVNKKLTIKVQSLPCNLIWMPPAVKHPKIVCATGTLNEYVIEARAPGTAVVLLRQRRIRPPQCNVFTYKLIITVPESKGEDLSYCSSSSLKARRAAAVAAESKHAPASTAGASSAPGATTAPAPATPIAPQVEDEEE